MSDSHIKVLFVDDEEGNLKAFKSTFRREMKVFLASSAEEALGILERESVHVIVSDQRMPGMTGSEFLAIARKRYPKAMRILLTGYADLEAVISAVNQGGIHAYATKPWDANDLLLRIQQAYENQQLRESKEKLLNQYRQIFESSGDPIVLVDHRGGIMEGNAACSRLLGKPMEELRLSRFTEFLLQPENLMRSLKGRRSGNAFVNVDLTIRTTNGDLIDCLMTATYLGRQENGTDLFQAIIKDITDRKQEEKRLSMLNAELDKRVTVRTSQLLEALEDLGSFSYTVAHDLRSPLKNIAALSEHLKGHALDLNDGTTIGFTERISKGAQRMLDLVDDLLRFSQTNTRELDLKEVGLASLVEEVIEELVPEERKPHVTMQVKPDIHVRADAPMLKVVLQNLLSNALKFSRDRNEPRISVEHDRCDDHDIIRVSDNGVGFNPLHAEQVFAPFKRLHPSDQFEGTGVGLAIVQRIMRKHNGQVHARSEQGKGTTIELMLPSGEQDSAAAPFRNVA